MPQLESQQINCYLIISSDKEFHSINSALKTASQETGIKLFSSYRKIFQPLTQIHQQIYMELVKSDLVFAVVSHDNPNIFYEVGLAHAMSKPIIFFVEEGLREVPFLNLTVGPIFPIFFYKKTESGLSELQHRFRKLVEDFRKAPRRFRTSSPFPIKAIQPPFIIDMEKLAPREFENLCFELLSQMGFRRMEWGKGLREIDLVATLPKKDPDGYEYQELWLISMGLHAPLEMILEMAMREPEHFLNRILRFPERVEELSPKIRADVPITILLILRREGPASDLFERDLRRMERRFKERPYPITLRVRLWDANYLINLIQQYPQIAYKYFSEEARSQSKYRKTPEELYMENVEKTEQLQATLTALQEEKGKRIRAERDAVWKDVAFKAAHKLGNPVYAIETDLQSLKKRIISNTEALGITDEMGGSLEKAKTIIEQFKSLTKAQEINPRPIDLQPIIENACRVASKTDITVDIKVPEEIPRVMADPIRMNECFDELVANALHWFDKAEKKISVAIDKPKKNELPNSLEQNQEYLRIRFEDNGQGVPLENKEMIFTPFYTTYTHGTGLGLSLVQRIIEGQGGLILENGKPGAGASFEIYLPIASPRKYRRHKE